MRGPPSRRRNRPHRRTSARPGQRIRLVVVDDHPLVLAALENWLSTDREFVVVGYCRSGAEALATVSTDTPDILLLDLRLPDISGLEVLRQLKARSPVPRIVLLTAFPDWHDMMQAVKFGADGLILKSAGPDVLLYCLRKVWAGESCLDAASVATAFKEGGRGDEVNRTIQATLTTRQLQIVRCVVEGGRNREIATRLGISEGTVKIHLHQVFKKLGVRSRVELTVHASRLLFMSAPPT